MLIPFPLNNLKFLQANWCNARKIFQIIGKFEGIWILGNSIAHRDLTRLIALFHIIADLGLQSKGFLACDVRFWEKSDLRSPELWRGLGEVRSADGDIWQLSDRAETEAEKQTIYYRALSENKRLEWSLIYNRFSLEDLKKSLTYCGFRCYEWSDEMEYLYRVVCAIKA